MCAAGGPTTRVDFDVVLGMLDGDVFPRGHGHQLRLHVEGTAAAIVARALRKPAT